MRVFACMASSLDGKIGPANVQQFVAITSRHDMEHLKSLRDKADGILFGAGTFRTWPKVHHGHDYSKKQHHFIMSRSLDLDVNSPLFQAIDIPLTIFYNSKKPLSHQPFPAHVKLIQTPEDSGHIPFIVKYLKKLGINSLLVEGGGQILHQFIDARILQELYLTLAPIIIGENEAPGLLGNQTLTHPPKVRLLSSQQIKDETYLHLELHYP